MPPRAAETPQNHLMRGAHRRQKNDKCQKRRAPSKPRRGDRPQAGVQPLTDGATEWTSGARSDKEMGVDAGRSVTLSGFLLVDAFDYRGSTHRSTACL